MNSCNLCSPVLAVSSFITDKRRPLQGGRLLSFYDSELLLDVDSFRQGIVVFTEFE